MNKITHFTVYIIVISLTVLLPGLTWAADEELTDSVYLDYDPVTGTFTQKLVNPQTDPNQAQSSVDVPGSQVEPALTVDQQSVVDGQAVQTGISNTGQEVVPAGTGSSTFIVWGGIGIVLVLVIGFFTRKYQQKLTS